jgi:hypothetical protein
MGEVLATLLAPKDFIITLDIVEATAALRAVLFIRELGFYKIVFDVIQVVQALEKDGRNKSRYGHLIEESQEVLYYMHTWQVNHINCNFNRAAYRLANDALFMSAEHVFY